MALRNTLSKQATALMTATALTFGSGYALAEAPDTQNIPTNITTQQQLIEYSKSLCNSRTGEFAAVVAHTGDVHSEVMRAFEYHTEKSNNVKIATVVAPQALDQGHYYETFMCGFKNAANFDEKEDGGDAYRAAGSNLSDLNYYYTAVTGQNKSASMISYKIAVKNLKTNYPGFPIVGENNETPQPMQVSQNRTPSGTPAYTQ